MTNETFEVRGSAHVVLFRNPGLQVECFDPDLHRHLIIAEELKKNIILNQGKASVVDALALGVSKTIARMAIGDRGTIPSDTQVPKVSTPGRTSLFHEIYRRDVQTVTKTTLGNVNEILFVTTFNAVDVPKSAFVDQSAPLVNECGLVLCDLISGQPLPRDPVVAPNLPLVDEKLFSHLPFNSVPFKAEDEVSITVRYKIYVV